MLILSGLFRKVVIADNCALLADAAFSAAWTAQPGDRGHRHYAFAWQIYGDFSGYSDIARGSAQLLGFHFMVNFRQPYLATSLQDFWRRWHISLSTWLRDYLYIPLGGNRHGGAADVSQPVADDAARRVVARRELDLRRLGQDPWRRARRRTALVGRAGFDLPPTPGGSDLGRAHRDVPRCLLRLGVLPRAVSP